MMAEHCFAEHHLCSLSLMQRVTYKLVVQNVIMLSVVILRVKATLQGLYLYFFFVTYK